MSSQGEGDDADQSKTGLTGRMDTADSTDGRKPYEWKSRYDGAWRQIIFEAAYTVFVALLSMLLIYLVWRGVVQRYLDIKIPSEVKTFRIYTLYFSAGMLGGSVFCLKYFYRVVARGYWHQDRSLWRFMSPLISAQLAFAIGALINSQLIKYSAAQHTSTIVGTGFLVGYFGDLAVAKMHEVANVLFGTTSRGS